MDRCITTSMEELELRYKCSKETSVKSPSRQTQCEILSRRDTGSGGQSETPTSLPWTPEQKFSAAGIILSWVLLGNSNLFREDGSDHSITMCDLQKLKRVCGEKRTLHRSRSWPSQQSLRDKLQSPGKTPRENNLGLCPLETCTCHKVQRKKKYFHKIWNMNCVIQIEEDEL